MLKWKKLFTKYDNSYDFNLKPKKRDFRNPWRKIYPIKKETFN